MLTSDVHAVLLWWLVLLVLGVGFLPLTLLLFSRFFDRGYIFSKLLGAAIASYGVYLLGIAHLVPFGQISSFVVMVVLIGLCYYLAPGKAKLQYLFKTRWKVFVAEELFFLAALFTWAYVHSFAPDIHGLEKYMDFGFINSILRTSYFPPRDMWFTPFPINYYYYGHYITAFLTKLSGIPSYITFNLMMCTIFAFCLTQTFSLGANFYKYFRKSLPLSKVKLLFAGLLTGVLTTFAGNLHILYGFFGTYPPENPVPFWTLPFKPYTFPNGYWYPNATRFIYHTIHEFPIYSWTVADLHGHVLDIPFVLFTVAVLFSMFLAADPAEEESMPKTEEKPFWVRFPLLVKINSLSERNLEVHLGFLITLGFLLAVMYMTNAWDGGIYLLLTILVLFSIQWQKHLDKNFLHANSKPMSTHNSSAKKSKNKGFFVELDSRLRGNDKKKWVGPFLDRLVKSVLVVGFTFALFAFPFSVNFNAKELVSGVGVLCAPKFLTDKGRIGPLLFEANHCQHSTWWELLTLYGFFYFFVLVFLVFLLRTKKILRSDTFVLLLIVIATLLILIPELFYMKDIYPAHYRANTMFKLVFQAFILLSLSSGYIIARILNWVGKDVGIFRRIIFPYILFLPMALVLCALVLTYPSLAVNSYYGNLKTYQGLNGIVYLQHSNPSDFGGIEWLNEHVSGQPVILEAQGDSYTDFARVSVNTGLPTVLGWTVHEWLWRGSYDVPAPRITDVKTLYETKDLGVTKQLLKKYLVEYVFVGSLEYQKYPALDEAKFGQLGKVVYENGQTKIYRMDSL